jgi:2-haloacid dehalogenase
MPIDTIIWDLGGVLVDWDPRYLYKKVFRTEAAVEYFLSAICTSDWNEEQDAGRSFEEATTVLSSQFPEYKTEISMFYDRWAEMLAGPIHENVELLRKMKESGKLRLYALTNWSAQSFPVALERFEFLQWFDGILVSGQEKLKKPDPAIYYLTLERFNIDRSSALFIDDNLRNVKAARSLNISSIHFENPVQLYSQLVQFGLIG